MHLTAVEAVHDEDEDSAEIYQRGSETLLVDAGTVVDVRGDESIIELDKQRLTYPDDDDYVSPCVRLSEVCWGGHHCPISKTSPHRYGIRILLYVY